MSFRIRESNYVKRQLLTDVNNYYDHKNMQ